VNIAIFGGTFDPIHSGHLRAAQAATRRFRLDRVLFIPSGNPPHKLNGRLTAFIHRYAMVALACAGLPQFVPSLLEAPRADGRPCYSVDTARTVRKSLAPNDRLFFLIGVDAFLELPQWKNPDKLLDLANFIVVSRPGFHVREILGVISPRMLAGGQPLARDGTVRLRHSSLHILSHMHVPVSSSDIRKAIRDRRPVTGLIPPLVEEYIVKHRFYPFRARRGAKP
jgi:nicotinate-nucleotide adenylyltransferase